MKLGFSLREAFMFVHLWCIRFLQFLERIESFPTPDLQKIEFLLTQELSYIIFYSVVMIFAGHNLLFLHIESETMVF